MPNLRSWQPGGKQSLQHNETWGRGSAYRGRLRTQQSCSSSGQYCVALVVGHVPTDCGSTARTTLYLPLCPTAWHCLPDTAGALEGKVCRPESWPLKAGTCQHREDRRWCRGIKTVAVMDRSPQCLGVRTQPGTSGPTWAAL